MTPRAICASLALIALIALIALLSPNAWSEEATSASDLASSRPALREKRRILQAEVAVLERLLRRHRRGEDLSGAVLAFSPPAAAKRWPARAEVAAAERTLVKTRALLLRKKAALASRRRSERNAPSPATATPRTPGRAAPPPPTTASPIEAGMYLFRAGAYAEALAAWRRAPASEIQRTPGRLLRFGGAAEYAGDHALARATYEQLRELFPRSRQASDAGFRLRFLAWGADLPRERPESEGARP